MARRRVAAGGGARGGAGVRLPLRASRDGTLPEGVRAVCAPVFLNETPEPGLETLFTRAMRQELLRVGHAGRLGPRATPASRAW